MKKLTVGSLFAGIGGFDLGLERTGGFQVKWQVEIDPYCLKVLEKHWPHVKRYTDIKAVQWEAVEPVDLICGGFPCQPVSVAGKRKGTSDERWLWPEFVRCLGVLRPRYVLVENVPGLLTANDGRAFADLLRDMAASGYDAEWDCIPAAAVGAPHRRDRLWLVAYAESSQDVSDTDYAASTRQRKDSRQVFIKPESTGFNGGSSEGWWTTEPNVGRVADGIPHRVDRLKCLGNAVVPQVVEWIGHQILNVHNS